MSTRVADLTIDELQELLHSILRDIVDEIVEERLGIIKDPDEGLTMRPDVEQSLDDYLASDRRGDDADEVFRALGLE